MSSTVLSLLSNPKAWNKGRIATDAFGTGVEVDSPEAAKFCLLGGARRCYPGQGKPIQKISDAIKKLFPKRLYALTGDYDINLHRFNDDPATKHADVVAVLALANV